MAADLLEIIFTPQLPFFFPHGWQAGPYPSRIACCSALHLCEHDSESISCVYLRFVHAAKLGNWLNLAVSCEFESCETHREATLWELHLPMEITWPCPAIQVCAQIAASYSHLLDGCCNLIGLNYILVGRRLYEINLNCILCNKCVKWTIYLQWDILTYEWNKCVKHIKQDGSYYTRVGHNNKRT